MRRHTLNVLKRVLESLKTLGVLRSQITQASLGVWSDALEDLDDEMLLAGYDYVKKRGMMQSFSSASFIQVCKEAVRQRMIEVEKPRQITDGEPISVEEFAKGLKLGLITTATEKTKRGFYLMQQGKVAALLKEKKRLQQRCDKYETLTEEEQDKYAHIYIEILSDLDKIENKLSLFAPSLP